MLDDIKKSYEETAGIIPDWRQLDKNELVRLYIKNEDNDFISQAYLAAIILNYWGKIGKLFNDTCYSATEEECYDMLIDSILYAIEHRRWEHEDSSIYNDPAGPDKAINRKLKHVRINHLIAQNRDKRFLNMGTASLDELMEDSNGNVYSASVDDDYSFLESPVTKDVIKFFNNKDYFNAFLLDGIANTDCMTTVNGEVELDKDKLKSHLHHLNVYSDIFAEAYNLDAEKVRHAITYINNLTPTEIYGKIGVCIKNLKHILNKKEYLNAQ